MELNQKIENAKRHLAHRLATASNGYSQRTKKWTLILAGLCCASVCVLVMARPFITTHHDEFSLPAQSNIVYQYTPGFFVTDDDLKMLQQFITTMDSLKRVDKRSYDKAIQGRQGMIDSILLILKQPSNTRKLIIK